VSQFQAGELTDDINENVGQRLAAQKGQTDDIVGAMKAQERAQENDDDDEDQSD